MHPSTHSIAMLAGNLAAQGAPDILIRRAAALLMHASEDAVPEKIADLFLELVFDPARDGCPAITSRMASIALSIADSLPATHKGASHTLNAQRVLLGDFILDEDPFVSTMRAINAVALHEVTTSYHQGSLTDEPLTLCTPLGTILLDRLLDYSAVDSDIFDLSPEFISYRCGFQPYGEPAGPAPRLDPTRHATAVDAKAALKAMILPYSRAVA